MNGTVAYPNPFGSVEEDLLERGAAERVRRERTVVSNPAIQT